jgi:hypothetical protein
MSNPQELLDWIDGELGCHLDEAGDDWIRKARAEVAGGVDDGRFAQLLALASRQARRRAADISSEGRSRAAELLAGWDPVAWSVLDLLRVSLVLSRDDLAEESGPRAILEAFRFGDVGELCALARALQFLPQPEAYLWQARECCRSNMNEVFEAMACDNAFPAKHFDEVAWPPSWSRQFSLARLSTGFSASTTDSPRTWLAWPSISPTSAAALGARCSPCSGCA